jgi:hypothetical protein
MTPARLSLDYDYCGSAVQLQNSLSPNIPKIGCCRSDDNRRADQN